MLKPRGVFAFSPTRPAARFRELRLGPLRAELCSIPPGLRRVVGLWPEAIFNGILGLARFCSIEIVSRRCGDSCNDDEADIGRQ